MSCPWRPTIQVHFKYISGQEAPTVLLNKCDCYSVFTLSYCVPLNLHQLSHEGSAFRSKLSPAPSTILHYESMKKISRHPACLIDILKFCKNFLFEEWALSR